MAMSPRALAERSKIVTPRLASMAALLAACVLGAVAPASLLAQSTTQPTGAFIGQVQADRVYVRSGPGANFYEIGQLSKGDLVSVVEQKNGWHLIAAPSGTFCYIAKELVDADPNGKSGLVKGDFVNVRAASALHPNSSYAVINRVRKGTRLTILGILGNFYQITPPEKTLLFVSPQFVRPAPAGTAYLTPTLKFPTHPGALVQVPAVVVPPAPPEAPLVVPVPPKVAAPVTPQVVTPVVVPVAPPAASPPAAPSVSSGPVEKPAVVPVPMNKPVAPKTPANKPKVAATKPAPAPEALKVESPKESPKAESPVVTDVTPSAPSELPMVVVLPPAETPATAAAKETAKEAAKEATPAATSPVATTQAAPAAEAPVTVSDVPAPAPVAAVEAAPAAPVAPVAPVVSAPATAPAEAAKEAPINYFAAFSDLNLRTQSEFQKPLLKRKLEGLLSEYKSLVKGTDVPPSVRQGSDARISVLEKTIAIQELARQSLLQDQKASQDQQMAYEKKWQETQTRLSEMERQAPFEVEGRLQTSSAVEGKYALVNPATGRVVAYIDPSSEISLATLMGQYVGLRGRLLSSPGMEVKIIKVRTATLLPAPK